MTLTAPDAPQRVRGRVRNVAASGAYGFAAVIGADFGDVFVSVSDVAHEWWLSPGVVLEFTIIAGGKRPRAAAIAYIGFSSSQRIER